MLLLYFLLWTAVAANKPLYGKIGDKAVLTSDSVVNPITSIEWKHGADLAMEWYGDETFSYRHFKDRGLLNTLTGALTITGLTPDDSGSYTVEINNKVTSKTELLVISPVSKPTLSLWCEPEMTYCVLTCNGNTTGVELVTYRWTSDVTTWSSTKEHNITEEDDELWFSCAFENPVSSSSSEIVFNPFKENEPLYKKIGDKAELTADSVVNLITSIVWKHGPNIAMEWDGDNTTAYRHFKDRGSLDTSNGALTITGLTPDDSGNYTVEINNKLISKTELLVISLVSKPTLSEWCSVTYCVLTCNGNTTGAEPVTYWWTSGDITLSSTKEHKITMVEKELWLSWLSCEFENPVSKISSEKVFNPFIRNQLIAIAILFLAVCIILITFRHKGIIHFSHIRRTWVLKWTFIYILVCILVVFNIILMSDLNFEGRKGNLTWMFILIAVFAVILVGGIIGFIFFYLKYKAAYDLSYYAEELKKMSILIPVLFLDIFNIIINLIYEGGKEDLTMMIIVIAIVGVILVGFIILFIYLMKKLRRRYLILDLIYMVPCVSGLFNIIILMYKAINGYLIWMIILTAIFGVILVGGIIAIIYLTYKDIKDDLRWTLILIVVCIPVVFNIINSLYRAIRGGLTWVIIVTAIFAVILVGFIISIIIIYLKYNDKFWDLTFTFMLIAVCISGVCNIIINFTYKGINEDLTWMFNFIPLCILVGFTIIIIYLIIFFRRKRRERAAERKWQEFLEKWDKTFHEMLNKVKSKISEINKTSTQDLETAESPDTSNETERPASLVVVQETSPQDTTSTGPPETSKETERSTTSPDVPETSTQDQETAESPDPSNETEMSVLLPPVKDTSTQDLTSVVVQDTSNGTVISTISEVHKTSTQDLETAESPDTNNETERPASLVEETSSQDTTSTGPPETSNETGEAAERRWQEMLKKLKEGETANMSLKEMPKKLKEEFLEWLAEGEAVDRTRQEYIKFWTEGNNDYWREEALKVRRRQGAAERIWQEFKERRDEGGAAERLWQGDAAVRKLQGEADERRWQEFLQRWDKEYLEWKKKGEAAERRWQEYLERLDEGEAAERRWQEYLEWKKNGAAERRWQRHLKKKRKDYLEWLDNGEAAERKWQVVHTRWDMGEAAEREWQEYLEWKRKGEAAERSWQEFLKRRDLGEAAERKWQEYLEWKRKAFPERWDEGEADERRWQEFLKRRDLGEAAERRWQEYLEKKRKDEADERRWQERLERLDKEYLERLDKGEAAERRRQEYQEWRREGEADETRWQEYLERLDEGEAAERARQEYQEWKRKGEAAERKWQEYLEWRREEFLERLDTGETNERAWQEIDKRLDMGEAAERAWQEFIKKWRKGEAAEKNWKEHLEKRREEHLEWRKEGEATERRWQGFLERLDKEYLEWRREGNTAERRWQEFLERRDLGEDDEREWQEHLERRRNREAAERSWQEMLEQLKEEMSEMLPPVQETSTQDPISVVVQDTSNGTVNSTSPDVPETSTQDLETVNETEESPMIPDNAETRC